LLVENITSWFAGTVATVAVVYFAYMFFIDRYTTHVNINKTCAECRNLTVGYDHTFACATGCRNEPTPDLIACTGFYRWYPDEVPAPIECTNCKGCTSTDLCPAFSD